jgi:uncharacterized caspase-like protein
MQIGRTMLGALAALALLSGAAPAQTASGGDGRRVALIIGNGAYGDMGVLTNPVRDARAVAASLRTAGFVTVITAEDLDVDKFQRNLREFRRVAEGASIALVYYAGHGVEVYGRNWLIPLGAGIGSAGDLPLEAVALDQVLTAIGGATVKVVILDACRNNPFERSLRLSGGVASRGAPEPSGLAPISDEALTDGMVVMYAAAPGMTASDGRPEDANSPFARALVEKLPTRGVDVRLVAGGVRDLTMRYTGQTQRPFVTSSLGETPVPHMRAGAPS